jgi:uncharacterized membrane protein YqjE
MKEELKEHWWMYLLMLVMFVSFRIYMQWDTDNRWLDWLVFPLILFVISTIGLLWGSAYRRKNKDFRESIEREYKNLKK